MVGLGQAKAGHPLLLSPSGTLVGAQLFEGMSASGTRGPTSRTVDRGGSHRRQQANRRPLLPVKPVQQARPER